MGLAAHQHGLLQLQFTSFNGAVNGGNEGENLISGIFCCSYGGWLVVTHPVRCVWLPTAPTAFWWSADLWTPCLARAAREAESRPERKERKEALGARS